MDWKPSRDLEQPAHGFHQVDRHIKKLLLIWTASGTVYDKLILEPGAYGRNMAHKPPVLGRIESAVGAARYPFLERQIVRASGKAH